MLTACLLIGFDALAVVALAAAVVIAITGGGRVEVPGLEIRAHSTGSLLLFLIVWGLVRYRCRHRPLLALSAAPLASLPDRALRGLDAIGSSLDRLTRHRARTIVLLLSLGVVLLKTAIVVSHPGFLGGDDVEVHEMTLGGLLGTGWPVWELRSAFYPMGVVYPVQWLARAAGWSDVAHLVIAGRLAVVAISTISVAYLYRIATRRAAPAIGIVAATLLATSSLSVEFGATELPRPIAALIILIAYGILTSAPRAVNAIAAGALVGVAACLRFSEVVFVLPLIGHLAADKRVRHAVYAGLALAATATTIQCVSDLWYWGTPFASVRAIVAFTLVDRLSSRGYDAWWYYVREISSWSDYLAVALAVYATPRHRRLSLWVWLPLAALSVLPHKEPRYLVPVVPLLSLLAAHGLMALVTAVRARLTPAAPAITLGLLAAVALRTLDQTSKYHVTRTDGEVAVARAMAPSLTSAPVLAEQAWRFGGHLYLGHGRRVNELEPDIPDPTAFEAAIARTRPGLSLVSNGTCDRTACAATLMSRGYHEVLPSPLTAGRYRLFRLPAFQSSSLLPACSLPASLHRPVSRHLHHPRAREPVVPRLLLRIDEDPEAAEAEGHEREDAREPANQRVRERQRRPVGPHHAQVADNAAHRRRLQPPEDDVIGEQQRKEGALAACVEQVVGDDHQQHIEGEGRQAIEERCLRQGHGGVESGA